MIGVLATLATLATASAQVDAQNLQAVDGGRYPRLMEPDLGIDNSLAASFTLHIGGNLAILRVDDQDAVLVDRVTTQDLHVSMNVMGAARVGLAIPRYAPVIFGGQRTERSYAGDLAIFVQGPLADTERFRSSLTAQVDFPLGAVDVWLGDPDPSLDAITSNELRFGRITTLLQLGIRLSRNVPIPGMRWGNHWDWGLGTRWEPYGPLGLTGEVFGLTPLWPIGGPPGAYPVETLATVDVRLGPVTIGIGGGRGLTRGLSSPSFRFLGRLDVRPHVKSDRDGDGVGDLADVCPRRKEDFDEFRDGDGCPDEDNDADGIRDVDDACPDEPEVVNGWEDRDGCPDAHAVVEVFVEPADRPDATLAWQGRTAVAKPDRPVFIDVDAGVVSIAATAPGFVTAETAVRIDDGDEGSITLVLEPEPIAEVTLTLADPDGAPLVGTWIEGDGSAPEEDERVVSIPENGLALTSGVGRLQGRVRAEGFFPGAVDTDLVAGEQTVEVVLQPASLDADIAFENDSATLTDSALDYLNTLRDWLADHPEVRLLRIEGQADDRGTSRYNYRLSTSRAANVRDWLVSHGIDSNRLQAIGSGEAAIERRQVRFRVLVWEDK